MVFQRPNPFPKSIYDNVAFAPQDARHEGEQRRARRAGAAQAALWDEVKDRLKRSALALSGGQQQRLCIARALAVEPEVILLDEPASALDPISTAAIEDLMHELKREYTLVIVTHNMQQAARVADMTAFFSLEVTEADATASSSSTTRPPRSSPTLRQADGGLRHRTIRMRVEFQEELHRWRRQLQEESDLVLRSLRGALTALDRSDIELADEVIALRRRGRRGYLRSSRASRSARPQTPVASRPAARARDPARQPPPRADGRLLRDDRQAGQADRRPAGRTPG